MARTPENHFLFPNESLQTLQTQRHRACANIARMGRKALESGKPLPELYHDLLLLENALLDAIFELIKSVLDESGYKDYGISLDDHWVSFPYTIITPLGEIEETLVYEDTSLKFSSGNIPEDQQEYVRQWLVDSLSLELAMFIGAHNGW